MSQISLRRLTKRYGKLTILHDISLDIAHGEFVVLVGPSGCGKSTLLRTLAGLEPITEGDILVDGQRVNDVPARHRNVSMVFQSYALFPHLKVDRNISFGLELRNVPQAGVDAKVQEVAQMLNLTDYLKRFPRQLSGGQRQRVAMGRAIVRQPSMFLFDEPLSNLDAKLRVNMRAEIKTLHMQLKNTIVYVTHDQVEAMTMADRIVVMRDGVIEQQGRPIALYDHPETMFVAGFLGSPAMNFLEGSYKNGAVEMASGERIPAPRLDLSEGHKISVGVRPEDVSIGADGINATIKLIEFTGSDTLIHLVCAGTNVTVLSHTRMGERKSGPVSLHFDVKKLHYFDTDTGCRLKYSYPLP